MYPTRGKSFTVTNQTWFMGKNAGELFNLGFQMNFAGKRNPIISEIRLNGEKVC